METESQPVVQFVFNAKLVRIVDGDTVEAMVDRGFSDQTKMMVRIYGADCPECRGHERAAGEWVGNQVAAWFGDHTDIVLHSIKTRASFSRYLFNVWCQDRSLSDWLVEKNYAWPTDKNGQVIGPRDIERLGIPDGVKQQVREALA